MDTKRKCIVDGCENLGDWNKIISGTVYRRRMCKKHIKLQALSEDSTQLSDNDSFKKYINS